MSCCHQSRVSEENQLALTNILIGQAIYQIAICIRGVFIVPWVHLPHCNLQGDSTNKIHQKRHYCGTFSYHFADISGRKLKFFFAEFLRYGNPDMHFLGTLKNKLQISQKCEYSHYEFEVRCDFRGDI